MKFLISFIVIAAFAKASESASVNSQNIRRIPQEHFTKKLTPLHNLVLHLIDQINKAPVLRNTIQRMIENLRGKLPALDPSLPCTVEIHGKLDALCEKYMLARGKTCISDNLAEFTSIVQKSLAEASEQFENVPSPADCNDLDGDLLQCLFRLDDSLNELAAVPGCVLSIFGIAVADWKSKINDCTEGLVGDAAIEMFGIIIEGETCF